MVGRHGNHGTADETLGLVGDTFASSETESHDRTGTYLREGGSSHSDEGGVLCSYEPVIGGRALCGLAAPRAVRYAVEIVVRNFVGRGPDVEATARGA